MALHAELHRHLGGAVVPRIFWRYLVRNNHPLADEYPNYESFESFFTRPRGSLTEYLELHSLVESVQTLQTVPYFVSKLVRGASVFEGICYLELRHTPFYRTDQTLPMNLRLEQMSDIVRLVGTCGQDHRYPLLLKQILCMHSRLPYEVNLATVELALKLPEHVCGIDLAGPDTLYRDRIDEWIDLFTLAKEGGLKTTGHLFETANGCEPRLLPYLDRIGHGIQIPLSFPELLPEIAGRGQCLEVCPTTYLKTGTLCDLTALRDVFGLCRQNGVDIAICTDNAGLHNVRLPWEFENLLNLDIIDFDTLAACQDAAFKHAFAWPATNKSPRTLLAQMITPLPA